MFRDYEHLIEILNRGFMFRIHLILSAQKPLQKDYTPAIIEKCGVKIALATANDKELYEPCLKRLKIISFFDYIIDVDKVKEGKSSPKIFNAVSEYFGVKPSEILVLEDSLMGLKTAKNAGYITVGVDDKLSKASVEDKKSESYLYVTNFDELIKVIK